MIEFFVLNDNRNFDKNLVNCHGFSLLIKTESQNFLFDFGQKDCFIKNAEKLNVDLSKLDFGVLSHGHYDHSDGLKFLENKIPLYCHPDCVNARISKRTNRPNGLTLTKEEFLDKFTVNFSVKPLFITEKIVFLGQVERIFDFECKNFPSFDLLGNTDIQIDDTGLCLITKKGLIVISGCGHSGICNLITYAKKVTGINKIYAVIGGFHLENANEQTDGVVEFFKSENIPYVFVGHCVSDSVIDILKKELSPSTKVQPLSTGYKFCL